MSWRSSLLCEQFAYRLLSVTAIFSSLFRVSKELLSRPRDGEKRKKRNEERENLLPRNKIRSSLLLPRYHIVCLPPFTRMYAFAWDCEQ
jgi:hypothetical protein